MQSTNSIEAGTIAEDYELTGYEVQVLRNIAAPISPVRDEEYAPVVGCFLREYSRTRENPYADVAEMISADLDSHRDDAELSPKRLTEKNARRERNRQRRREVADDVLRRSGYRPTPEQMEHELAVIAEMEADCEKFHREIGWA